MTARHPWILLTLPLLAGLSLAMEPAPLPQEPNTWIKRSPGKDVPRSPGMGYETSLGYDPIARKVIRWGGHNQGGGGEQNAETWVLDPATMKWELKEPNRSPPGVCCAQQNVFDPVGGRFLRFPAFSGSHGWHWFRENYLNNSSLWTYDLAGNTWRDMRPVPTPHPAPLRCSSWDSHHQVAVVFGGEGSTTARSFMTPTPTPGRGCIQKRSRPDAAPATWLTTPPASCTSFSARSSATIRTPGPMTSPKTNGAP